MNNDEMKQRYDLLMVQIVKKKKELDKLASDIEKLCLEALSLEKKMENNV